MHAKRRLLRWLLASVVVGLVSTSPAFAGSVGQVLSRDSDASRFGQSVAVSGDTVVVGAPGFGVGAAAAGRVFVYERSGGLFLRVAELQPSTSSAQDGFGSAVAVGGDTIAVGSYSSSGPDSGFVFERPVGGWSGIVGESAELEPSGTQGTRYGAAIAIDGVGSTVVVGDSSRVHLFEEPGGGWTGAVSSVATLIRRSNPSTGTPFGNTVAIDGDTVAAGDPVTTQHNAVWVWVRPGTGWSGDVPNVAELSLPFPEWRGFGAVAVRSDTIVVGASRATVGGNLGQGEAYVYVRPAGGWVNEITSVAATLRASDGRANDGLGSAVAMDGNVVLVGGPSRAVYQYVEPGSGWSGVLTETDRLRSLRTPSAFGREALAIDGGVSVVGDHQSDGPRVNLDGQAYVYLNDADNDTVADIVDNCPAVPNRGQADLDGDELGDPCDPDVDGDDALNGVDNCPLIANGGQADLDSDDVGDLCDADDDGDGVDDADDNCPVDINASQADLDGDGAGDLCDADDDGDGVNDDVDNCLVDVNPMQYEMDGDEAGDACDSPNAVVIDVLPGDDINFVWRVGRFVSVAILSTPTFDAPDRIDQAALRFGRTGDEAASVGCIAEDVDGDLLADLVCDFELGRSGFRPGDEVGVLTGMTSGVEATAVIGDDAVQTMRSRRP